MDCCTVSCFVLCCVAQICCARSSDIATIENNRYYRANAICLNEETLQRLPQDGNLTDMRFLQLGESSTFQCEPSEDLYGAHVSTSFVPNVQKITRLFSVFNYLYN